MAHILVMENDPLAMDCLKDLLEAESFRVTGVTDGNSAKEIITQQKFDLILCDIVLPHGYGYEFLSYLRNQKDTEDVPFIVLTGKSKIQDINLGREMGVDDYLIKPCSNHKLVKSINTQLERRKFLEKCYQAKTQISPDVEPKNLSADTAKQNLYSSPRKVNEWDRQTDIAKQSLLINRFNKVVSQYITERIKSHSKSSLNKNSLKKSSIAVCCLRLGGIEQAIANSPRYNRELQKIAAQKLISSIGFQANILCLQNGDLAIFLPYIKNIYQAIKIIRIGQKELLKPSLLGSTIISLRSYVGISFDSEGEGEIKTLLERSQQVLKKAQADQDNCYEVYSPNPITAADIKSLVLVEKLHDYILSEGNLSTSYQPQVDLSTGKVIGCEALLSWCHPLQSNIPAEILVSTIEETSSIESTETKFMFDECVRLKNLHQQGFKKLKLHISISSSQFNRDDFAAIVQQVLTKVKLKPQFLTIQLTQNTLLKNKRKAIACLGELKSLGVGIVLTQFEHGHSSLNYLKQFPLTALKVDLGCLNSLLKTDNSLIALKYITRVAKLLKLQLIIDGVESRKQLNFLRQHHFAMARGNYLSPPLKLDEFKYLLSDKSEWLTILFSFPPI